MSLEISDQMALFARNKFDTVKTLAEQAHREGYDIDVNPYSREHQFQLHNLWNTTWIMCNRYC